jgi:hypothetical protein
MTRRYDYRLALRASTDIAAARPLVDGIVAEIGLVDALGLIRREVEIAMHEAERHRRKYVLHGDVADDDSREAAEARRRALIGILIERDPEVDRATRTTAVILDLRTSRHCEDDRKVLARAVAELGLEAAAELLEGQIHLAESFARHFDQIADRDDDRYLAREDASLQLAKAEDWRALLREHKHSHIAA